MAMDDSLTLAQHPAYSRLSKQMLGSMFSKSALHRRSDLRRMLTPLLYSQLYESAYSRWG